MLSRANGQFRGEKAIAQYRDAESLLPPSANIDFSPYTRPTD
jgi:hypothetical protein